MANNLENFSEVGNVTVKTTENGKIVTRKIENHICTITPNDNPLISFGREGEKSLIEIRQDNEKLGVVISQAVIENIDNEELKALLKSARFSDNPVVVLTCKNEKSSPIKINSTQNQFIVEVAGQDNVVKEYKCIITPIGITFDCEDNGEHKVGEYQSPEFKPINVSMSKKFVNMALSDKDKTASGLNVATMPRHVAVPYFKSLLSENLKESKPNAKVHTFKAFDDRPYKNRTCEIMTFSPDGDDDLEKNYYFISVTSDDKKNNYVLHNGQPVKVEDVIVEISQETGLPTLYLSHTQKNGKKYQTCLEFGKNTKNGPRMTKEEIGILQEITNFYGAQIPHEEDNSNSINVSNTKNDFYVEKGSKRPANNLTPFGGRNRTIAVDMTQNDYEEISVPGQPAAAIAADGQPLETSAPVEEQHEQSEQLESEIDEQDYEERAFRAADQTQSALVAANEKFNAMRAEDDDAAEKRDKAIKKKATPTIGVSVAAAGLFLMLLFPMIGPLAVILGGALAIGGGVWFTIADRFANPYIPIGKSFNKAIGLAKQHAEEKASFLENERTLNVQNKLISGLESQMQDVQHDNSLSDTEKLEKLAIIERQINEAAALRDEATLKQNERIVKMDDSTFQSLFCNPNMDPESQNALAQRYANGIVRRVLTRPYSSAVTNEMLSHYGPKTLEAFANANKEYLNEVKGLAERKAKRDELLNQKANDEIADELLKMAENAESSSNDGRIFNEILGLLTPEQSDMVVKAVNEFEGSTTDEGTPRDDLWNVIKGALDNSGVQYKDLRQQLAREAEADVAQASRIVGEREAEYIAGLNGRRTRDENRTVDDAENKTIKNLNNKIEKQQKAVENKRNKVEEYIKEATTHEKVKTKIEKVQKGHEKPRTQKQLKKIEETVARIETQHEKKYQVRADKAQKQLDKTQKQLDKTTDILRKEEPTVTLKKVQERSDKLAKAVTTLSTHAVAPETEGLEREVAPAAEAAHGEHTHDGHEAS